ncbi:hypothetical protein CF326_g6050 [Tilletia indica]|nr:hypothetical protein CF326_g6050 [Tilletia indica]
MGRLTQRPRKGMNNEGDGDNHGNDVSDQSPRPGSAGGRSAPTGPLPIATPRAALSDVPTRPRNGSPLVSGEGLPSPFRGAIPDTDDAIVSDADDDSDGLPDNAWVPVERTSAEQTRKSNDEKTNALDYLSDAEFYTWTLTGKFAAGGPLDQANNPSSTPARPSARPAGPSSTVVPSSEGDTGKGVEVADPSSKSSELASNSTNLVINRTKINQAQEAAEKLEELNAAAADGDLSPRSDARAFKTHLMVALDGVENAFSTSSIEGVATSTSSSDKVVDDTICITCLERFDTKAQLATHRRKEHSGSILHAVKVWGVKDLVDVMRVSRAGAHGPETGFPCPRCDILMELPSNLRRHCAGCKRGPDPEPSKEWSMPTKVTLDLLKTVLVADATAAYQQPSQTQQTGWTKRLGAVAVMAGQDLKKAGQLLERVSSDGKRYTGRLPMQIAAKVKQTCHQAMAYADDLLSKRPIFELQLLAVFDAQLAPRARPMMIAPKTAEDYAKTFEKMMMFIMSLTYLCYGDALDVDADPRPAEDGLKNAMTSLVDAGSTLKGLIGEAAATHAPQAYWRLAAYLYTTTLPDEPEKSLLLNFVSTLALKQPINGDFKKASEFTPDLSRLIYVLKKCWGSAQHVRITKLAQDMEDFGNDIDRVKGKDHFRQEELRDAHNLDFGAEALYSCTWKWLDSIRAFGQACASKEDGLARCVWAPDGKSVRVGTHDIQMDAMKAMMKAAVTNMDSTLKELVGHCTVPLHASNFPLEHLVDDPTWTDPGASFATHPTNSALLRPEIFGDDVLSRHYNFINVVPGGQITKANLVADADAIGDMQQTEKKFLIAAAVAIHLTSGMPSRAEELTEATVVNDAGARDRSFFLGKDGEVFMDLTYSKSEWASSRKNLRVLLPAVGRMWAFYLGMVRPTLDMCFRMEHGVARTYAWCNMAKEPADGTVKWRGDVISTALGELSATSGLGFKINVSTLRHFAEAVCHKFFRAEVLEASGDAANTASNLIAMGYEPDEDQAEEFCDALDSTNKAKAAVKTSEVQRQDAFSAQSGRSLDTSWRLYARVIQHRSGVNDGIIAGARLASLTWQSFWSLTQINMGWGKTTATNMRSNPVGEKVERSVQTEFPSFGNIRDMMATAPKTQNGKPAGSLVTILAPNNSQGPEKISDELRSLISNAVAAGVASAMEQQKGCSAVSYSNPTSASKKAINARFALSIQDAKALEKLHRGSRYGGIRSIAVADTLTQVVAGRSHVVCVATTGAGKSDVIFLAAILAKREMAGLILLIVPYNALIQDMITTLRTNGIPAVWWEGPQSLGYKKGQPHVIVVSLNRAVSKPLLTWLSQPLNADRIERVIMDEAQVLLDERTLRSCVKHLPELTSLLKDKHWTFLSATIPPRQEAEFQQIVQLPLTFNRELTHRESLCYSIRQYSGKQQLVLELKALIAKATGPETYQRDQVMIVVKSKHDAMVLSASLNVGAYYTGTSDESPDAVFQEGRDAVLQAFLKGTTRVIVGTTGISVGINRPSVGLVVYIDAPYSIVSFAQGSGRASRDGRRGDIIVYLREDKDSSLPTTLETEDYAPPIDLCPTSDGEALKMLLGNQVCLRLPMCGWLDGRVATCFELAAEPCSVCARNRGLKLSSISPTPSIPDSETDEDAARFEVITAPDLSDARTATQPTGSDLARAGGKPTAARQEGDRHAPTSAQVDAGKGASSVKQVGQREVDGSGYKRLGSALSKDNPKKTRQENYTAATKHLVEREKALIRAAVEAMDDGRDILDPPQKPRPAPGIHPITGRRVAPGLRASWSLDSDDIDEEPDERFLQGSLERMAAGAPPADVLEPPPPSGQLPVGDFKGKGKAMEPASSWTDSVDFITSPPPDEELDHATRRPAPWSPFHPLHSMTSRNTPAGLAAEQSIFGPGSSRTNANRQVVADPVWSISKGILPEFRHPTSSTPTSAHLSTSSGPNMDGLATKMRTGVATESVERLSDVTAYSGAVRDILPKTRSKCPMCHLLKKPSGHAPARCTTEHLDMTAQMKFRRDQANRWGYGQACFYCHLPQDICLRRNEIKECSFAEHKDLVRGMLMLLSAYPGMLATANDLASLFNKEYVLGPPAGALQMGEEWRSLVYFHGVPMYRAFQAIAALLFVFDGRL